MKKLKWDQLPDDVYEKSLEMSGLEKQELNLMSYCQDHLEDSVKVDCTYLFNLLCEVAEQRVWIEVTEAQYEG